MNYEQFVRSKILFHERLLADIRAGRVFWCDDCECWCPMGEKRQAPWSSDWFVCIECLEDSGLLDSLVSDDEYNEHLADREREAEARNNDQEQNSANH